MKTALLYALLVVLPMLGLLGVLQVGGLLSEAWGLAPSVFTVRHERRARECPASLLAVRGYVAPAAPARSEAPTRRAPVPV